MKQAWEGTKYSDATDCYDLYNRFGVKSGVYSIKVDKNTTTYAYCMDEGWTVIQSRGDFSNGITYFARDWAEYKAGFGTPGNFFHLPI